MKKKNYLARGDFVYRHTPVPVFVKTEGPIMEDNNGHRFFCAEAANGTAGLGFDSSIMREAVDKIKNLPSIPSFCETGIRLKVGNRLGEKIEKITNLKGRVAFELGGAQAIELALRIARANNKKSQFVVFEGGYHGRSIYTAQLSASHRYRASMGDWRVPIIRLPYPDYEQTGASFSKHEWKKNYLNYLQTLISREVGGMIKSGKEQDVCVLIIEPVLNAGGIVKPDTELLEKIVEIFRNLGALIIVDEIFCGFYRTGKMFGFQHYNFKPDIIVMSKAITNGITPLSCVWAKDPYLSPDNFVPGSHSATFINQPFALAVADTVLDRYEQWKSIDKDIQRLEKSLNTIIKEIIKTSKLAVSGFALGGVGRILLKKNVAGEILDMARTIAWEKPVNNIHGLILASTCMAPNVIALNPPLRLSVSDIESFRELLIRTFKKANKELS